MKVRLLLYCIIPFMLSNTVKAQFFDSTQISNINISKTALEGDFYLDTMNKKYYIGISTGEVLEINSSTMKDVDGDTKVSVEDSKDEDQINFYTKGNKAMTIDTLGNIGIGGKPSTSALLDLRNTNDRVLQLPLIDTTSVTAKKVGMITYDSILKGLYVYDGSAWRKLSTGIKTTYETVPLSAYNQTIRVRNPEKIVGFTLLSSLNSLLPASGKMSGTWIINEDRNVIRCYIQTLEHPFIKFLAVSVQINNATNTITFSNYTSRFWNVTGSVPQGNLSNNGTNYRLGSIVIIREE